jgi:hypothetical protein
MATVGTLILKYSLLTVSPPDKYTYPAGDLISKTPFDKSSLEPWLFVKLSDTK